jgi:hypothetical protein
MNVFLSPLVTPHGKARPGRKSLAGVHLSEVYQMLAA